MSPSPGSAGTWKPETLCLSCRLPKDCRTNQSASTHLPPHRECPCRRFLLAPRLTPVVNRSSSSPCCRTETCHANTIGESHVAEPGRMRKEEHVRANSSHCTDHHVPHRSTAVQLSRQRCFAVTVKHTIEPRVRETLRTHQHWACQCHLASSSFAQVGKSTAGTPKLGNMSSSARAGSS